MSVEFAGSDAESDEGSKCPFVSEKGPKCPFCDAPPTSVNLDTGGGYGHCDECGGKFRIR